MQPAWRYSILVFFACSFFSSAAQYSFSQSSSAYADLSSPLVISSSAPDWDDEEFYLPIGFPIVSFGKTYDSMMVESNGSIILYDVISPVHDFFNSADTFVVLMPFGEYISSGGTCDLRYRSSGSSPIGYELSGIAGSRITKVEWKNAGFFNDTTVNYEDSANFQVWIYEATGDIEFRYGAISASGLSLEEASGPTTGIAHFRTSPDFDFVSGSFLVGSPAAASISSTPAQLTGLPASSTVYHWTNALTVDIPSSEAPAIHAYPNPASTEVTLSFPTAGFFLQVYDSRGAVIYTKEFDASDSQHLIPVSDWERGMYLIRLHSTAFEASYKLLVH